VKTWSDVQSFITKHDLPFNVIRFNMSLRGVLVDSISDESIAYDFRTAQEIVRFTFAEENFIRQNHK